MPRDPLVAAVVVVGVERRRVDDRFKQGTGLPISVDRAIELARAVVSPADHREYLAGFRIQRHKRCLQGAGRDRVLFAFGKDGIERCERLADCFVRRPLKLQINRRVDPV